MSRQAGIDLVKEFEGCRLKAYLDAVSKLTVGWGHTGDDVKPGMEITQEEADKLLEQDYAHHEAGVKKLLKRPVNENQIAALTCFAYNLGLGNLARSTLLNCINKGHIQFAPDEFLRWTKAGGRELPGLVRRRKAERALFLKA